LGGILDYAIIEVKTAVAPFWGTFGKINPLLVSTSGHTESYPA